MQPLYIGTHAIYVSTTYFTNNTAIRPFELKQMVSSAKLGEVNVQSDMFLSWPTADWLQHPLVLLIIGGVVTGIVGPRITNQHQNHQKKLQVAVDIIIKISKGHAEIDNSLWKLTLKIDEAVEKLSVETKGGIQKQKQELESKYKQLKGQKNKAKTDEADILLGQELSNTSDQLEKIKKVEEDLNTSVNESSKTHEEWLLSNREIASLTRTFYYRNMNVEIYYEIYFYSILRFSTRVGQYYNHVKDFSISQDFNKYDSSLRSDINDISYKSSNNTQSLIETIREETFKGPFQTFLMSMENKINKKKYDTDLKKRSDELNELRYRA